MRSGWPWRMLIPLLCAASLLSAIDVDKLPKPAGYVDDFANVVDAGSKDQLEAFCARVERELGAQFALVTIDSLDDRPIRDVALEIGRKWGVGAKGTNQGVLLLLAVKDRKSDIETGRGIEPYITDGFAGSTLRSMRPQLAAGNYGAALRSAAAAMAAQIARGKGIDFSGNIDLPPPPPPQRQVRRNRGGGIPISLVVFGIILLLSLFGRGRRGGGRPGGGGGFGSGFVTGMVLDELARGGRRDGGWGGGGFGGDSGGGGGFGGFGGGDFGGGGASSDW